MKKLLRTTDKLLLALSFVGDLYVEGFSRSKGFGWNRGYLESLQVKNSTFRKTVWEFLKTGEIEKSVDVKGRPCLKLRSPGRERIERIFPLYKLSSKPWDGKWRIVVFDIAEKERSLRNFLRDKLTSLGFGKLQESVYVTPLDVLFDLKEFLKEYDLYGKAIVFEAKELFSVDPEVIANYVWRLDEINEEYRRLLDKAGEIKKNGEGKTEIKELKEKLFELLLKDPILPKEFLPKDWVGDEARKTIMSL